MQNFDFVTLRLKKNTGSVFKITTKNCVAIDEAHCVLPWLEKLHKSCYFLSFAHSELMKERTISILKLMESKFQFCR